MDKARAGSDGKIFRRLPSRCRCYVKSLQLGTLSGKPGKITFVGGCESKRRIRAYAKSKVGIRNVVIGKQRRKKVVVVFVTGPSAAILDGTNYIYVSAANQ